MAKSMTGYGRSSSWTSLGKLDVEVKSLNHRYLDVSTRLPSALQEFEEVLRKRVAGHVGRGKVTLVIQHDSPPSAKDLEFNSDVAEFYVRSMRRLKKTMGLDGRIDLVELAGLPHVVRFRKNGRVAKGGLAILRRLVDQALMRLNQSREREGRALVQDVCGRLAKLRRLVKAAAHKSPQIVEAYKDRLQMRVKDLSKGIALDEARLSQEVALFADRCDISEEVTRALTHLDSFEKTLKQKKSIGRTLDFMTQELLREVNTIGSKSPDAVTARHVIDMKGVLGKIREQVQNIE